MGLHGRPSSMIVRLAEKYKGLEVTIFNGAEKASAKSIMEIMMLAACEGTILEVHAVGQNAKLFTSELQTLFNSKFFELE